MVAYAVAIGAIGVAVYGIVSALKTATGSEEGRLNRFLPLIALAAGVGLAWIPGAIDYVCELAGDTFEMTASPASKTVTGLIGGGCSAMYHSLWRTSVKGK